MIFRCIVCSTYWMGHDSSASVSESLCDKHRKHSARCRLPVHVEPVKSFYEFDKEIEFKVEPEKPSIQLLVMKQSAAVW